MFFLNKYLAHQDCIYLIKNSVKTSMLWNNFPVWVYLKNVFSATQSFKKSFIKLCFKHYFCNCNVIYAAYVVPIQSVVFDVTSESLTQIGSRPRAQSPSSVNKTSQWQLACVLCIAHPRRMQTHISFSLRSRAFQHESQSVCKTANNSVLVLRCVSGGCCPVLLFLTACCSFHSTVTLGPPLGGLL